MKPRSLRLHREFLGDLSVDELRDVAGASHECVSSTCPESYTCPKSYTCPITYIDIKVSLVGCD